MNARKPREVSAAKQTTREFWQHVEESSPAFLLRDADADAHMAQQILRHFVDFAVEEDQRHEAVRLEAFGGNAPARSEFITGLHALCREAIKKEARRSANRRASKNHHSSH